MTEKEVTVMKLRKSALICPTVSMTEYLYSIMNLWNSPLSLWGLSHATIPKDGNVLDIGCGGGKNLVRLLEKVPDGHVYGIDPSFRAVNCSYELNREACIEGHCHVYEGMADALPFQDNFFDFIMASETFYFWKDPKASLKEIRRVLRPGGQLLFIHSKSAGPVGKLYEKLIPGMKVYSRKRMGKMLEEAGFQITEMKGCLGALTIVSRKPLGLAETARRKLADPTNHRKVAYALLGAAALGAAIYGFAKTRHK